MKAYDIVGYTFEADVFCPEDVVHAVAAKSGVDRDDLPRSAEGALDRLADLLDIEDRMEEESFDSDDFPKVIFATQVEGDVCSTCREELI